MHVNETKNCARRSWGDDVHVKPIPPVLAREGHAGDTPEHKLPPSLDAVAFLPRIQVGGKARAGQQRHGRKGHALKRRLVLGVGDQKGSAHSGIGQERGPDVRCNFLEEDNIGRFRTLENMAEDKFGA